MFLNYTQESLLDLEKTHCFGNQKVPVELFKGPIKAVI